MRRKYSPRKPALSNLVVNISGPSSSGSGSSKARTVSPNLKASTAQPRTASNDVHVQKISKSISRTDREDPVIQVKAKDAEAKPEHNLRASGTARLSSLASKNVSYKEVAISPPGTVLKPALDQPEEAEIATSIAPEWSSSLETSKEENTASTQEAVQEEISSDNSDKDVSLSEAEKPSSSSDENQESSSTEDTTMRSKLSASAPPFNPGSLSSMSHPYNSVAVGGLNDARIAHQTVLPQPLDTPPPQSVDTWVPRGPRSTLYYRTGHTFRKRHGYPNGQNTVNGKNSPTMNPHAAEFVPGKAEFVPGKAWPPAESQKSEEPAVATKEETSEPEKKSHTKKIADEGGGKGIKSNQSLERAELAKQILFKFIVKSALNSSNEDEAKTEATAKAPECGSRTGKQPQTNAKSTPTSYKSKKQDTEGFTVVSNRRKNKHQLTNAVPGLYAQQSVCTSVS